MVNPLTGCIDAVRDEPGVIEPPTSGELGRRPDITLDGLDVRLRSALYAASFCDLLRERREDLPGVER